MKIFKEQLIFQLIESDQLEELSHLLDKNRSLINSRNLSGFTPLHYSILLKNEKIFELIMTFKPDINLASSKQCGQCTPLITASKLGLYTILQRLLKEEAYINNKDSVGKTALHHASSNNDIKCSKLLVENGADITIRDNFGNNPAIYLDESSEAGRELTNQGILGKSSKYTTEHIGAYIESFKKTHYTVDKRSKIKRRREYKYLGSLPGYLNK